MSNIVSRHASDHRRWPYWSHTARGLLILLIASLASPTGAEHPAGDTIRMTVVGGLTAGDVGRLAVRWSGGPRETQLDVWIDFDGNGEWGDTGEHVVPGRPLVEEIAVFDFQVPWRAALDCRTRVLWRLSETGGRVREGNWSIAGGNGDSGCAWSSDFAYSDLHGGGVFAVAIYDDGGGPALFVGGSFSTAGEVVANRIARWDGSQWSTLDGPDGNGVDDTVRAMAVYDDGGGPALFVGGDFTTAGGVTVNHLARWDGEGWSAVSSPGPDGAVLALSVLDLGGGDELYIGGSFKFVNGVRVNSVVRWNGSTWHPFADSGGIGINAGLSSGSVTSLSTFDTGSGENLYVGGAFVKAGGVWTQSVARWDGVEWSGLGTGLCNGAVYDLAVHDDGTGDALYAGGSFFDACSAPMFHVARWDGTVWSALTAPVDGLLDAVYDLIVYDDGTGPALYAGGRFTTTSGGGVELNHMARYAGDHWSALDGPGGIGADDEVHVLITYDDGGGAELLSGGLFEHVGGVRANRVAGWNGDRWAPLSPDAGAGLGGEVEALVVFDDGSGPALYAAGWFDDAGGTPVSHVARWDGSAWSDLDGPSGTGTTAEALALAVWDDGGGDALYVGGAFAEAGGVAVGHVAKWDVAGWSALSGPSATGTDDAVLALTVFDDGGGEALYAAGSFTTAGGVLANHVARWNGLEWSPLVGPSGTGTDADARALAAFDGGQGSALVVGGDFATAGGVNVSRVALWDGLAWYALYGPWAAGTSGTVEALAVYDDGDGESLYAGGSFTDAGGVAVYNIAAWDGGAWSALVDPFGPGTNGPVGALTVHDDGTGETLFLGGSFTIAGGITANRVASWDGLEFGALEGPLAIGVGPEGFANALASFNGGGSPSLFAGGDFVTAGGNPSPRIASWSCGSGSLFSDDFESGDTSAWSDTVP